jgi:hypothetical protein
LAAIRREFTNLTGLTRNNWIFTQLQLLWHAEVKSERKRKRLAKKYFHAGPFFHSMRNPISVVLAIEKLAAKLLRSFFLSVTMDLHGTR